MVQIVGPKEIYQMSNLASLAGSSLTGSISLKRSYGATRADSNCTDTRMLLHPVVAGDTLQGLAIKYGVTVEKIKRHNKLWSNESLFLRDTVKIPCVVQQSEWEDKGDEDDKNDKNYPRSNNVTQNNIAKQISPEVINRELPQKDSETTGEKTINCNEFLNDIDHRISKCKDNWARKQGQLGSDSKVPCVSYDSNDSHKLSPTKQNRPFLEKL